MNQEIKSNRVSTLWEINKLALNTIAISSLVLPMLLIAVMWPWDDSTLAGYLWLFFIFFTIISFSVLSLEQKVSYIDKKNIALLEFQKSISNWGSIQEIQIILETIQNLTEVLSSYKKSLLIKFSNFILRGKINRNITQYSKTFIPIFEEIKQILLIDINKQKTILNTAKSSLAIQFNWDTEFDQIWDIQQVRLENKIEQFEEIKKKLIEI